MKMLKGGRTNVNHTNDQGETALHKAALAGNIKAVEYLIKCSTVDINIKNRYIHIFSFFAHSSTLSRHFGETCLFYAVRRTDSTVRKGLVSLLLKYGADPSIRGHNGTCREVARLCGYEDVLLLLDGSTPFVFLLSVLLCLYI